MTHSWYRKNKHTVEAWAERKKIECYRNPKVEFPVYAKRIDLDIWVKFNSETTCEVIGGNLTDLIEKAIMIYVGETINGSVPFYNKNFWEIISNPHEICDKDAVWCWDNGDIHRVVRFWDTNNKCTFNHRGKRRGRVFNNYEKILPWKEPEWVRETRKYLKD